MEFIPIAGAHHETFQSFMWKSFIPLIKIVPAFDREMFNQVGQLAIPSFTKLVLHITHIQFSLITLFFLFGFGIIFILDCRIIF